MKDASGEAFWRFSLALYAQPGVAAAMIALQDRARRNVSLMLFVLWTGATRGETIAASDLQAAQAAIAALDDAVVAPLRTLRRGLKPAAAGDIEAMRRQIGGLEIAAERHVHDRLAATLRRVPRGPGDADRFAAAKANLARYLGEVAGSAETEMLLRGLAALMRRTQAAR
jgi:uncharacterized protein (TIGR02444 family)